MPPADLVERTRARAHSQGAAAALAGVAAGIALARGCAPPRALGQPSAPVPVPPQAAQPELLGALYETLQPRRSRREQGAWYTPPEVAAGVAALALAPLGPASSGVQVLDPAVGGGAVLLAAARRMVEAGGDPARVLAEQLVGVDVDPVAARVATASLELWAADHGVTSTPRVAVVNSLIQPRRQWPDAVRRGGAQVVVGNPPFQGQLRRVTARSPVVDAALRARFGALGAYADTAWLFLLVGLELAVPGGRVVLIQPTSVLAARDARPVRRRLEADAHLEHLWWARDRLFGAAVDVCIPVLVRAPASVPAGSSGPTPPSGPVTRSVGAGFTPVPPVESEMGRAPTWGWLTAGLTGPPSVHLDAETGLLGERCTATAGFRDHYYALVPVVREAETGACATCAPGVGCARSRAAEAPGTMRLVTSGLVDPLACHWGHAPASFARQRWQAPVVDLGRLATTAPAVARWASQRAHPKVVVAAQTRVVEAAVDVHGCWYPSTPTVAVHPVAGALWSVAAVLSAPPVSAWLAQRMVGTAMAADRIRIPAREVLAIPCPPDAAAWAEGARWARAATEAPDGRTRRTHLVALGRVMTEAYRSPVAVADWWAERLPA